MLAAIEEAEKLKSKILLGDRDIDMTLQSLSFAITNSDPERLVRLGRGVISNHR
jgi:pheromone shutdown protein TraB